MALLTAEDVLNKAFSKTKYREGFDQDEVDDFLDEVASTIASLTAERDHYAAQLAQGGGAPSPAYGAPSAIPQAMDASSLLAAATDPNPQSAPSMIAMAQKLHDDYVTAGEAEKENILSAARAEANQLLSRAEQDARAKMASLESERAELERKIDDLRRFERDYRGHLKNYLENLLGDIEHGEQRATGAIPQASAATVPVASAPVSQAPAAPVQQRPAAPPVTVPQQPTTGITPMPQWPTT